MFIAVFPLIVCVVGLALYRYGRGARLQRIGEIMFFCGLLAFCLGSNWSYRL